MKKRIFKITLFSFIVCIIYSCHNEKKDSPERDQSQITSAETGNDRLIVTDTIIYEMIIKNPDKEDFWKEECLQHLDRIAYVDYIFNSVYNGLLTPYSEETNQPLTINDIKTLENNPEFKRENIGMIQFYEKWVYNTTKNTFTKYVYSAILGYETFDNDSILRGYKPAFRVYFK